nr:TraX family protein [Peptoniphilus asaccharolyticus]
MVLMVCDHIHKMFYYAGNLSWLNMLGRLVLPIFLFMCAEGYSHTRNKGKYALRLYISGTIMGIVSLIISNKFPINDPPVVLMNNVFYTMFLSVVLMYVVDCFRQKKIFKGILILILPILPYVFLMSLIDKVDISVFRILVVLPSYFTV